MLHQRTFIGHPDLIAQLRPRLVLSQTLQEGVATVFKDTLSGQEWLETLMGYTEEEKPIFQYMKLPPPSRETLISLLLSSPHGDEVQGAASVLMFQEEEQGLQFREEVISHFETWTFPNLTEDQVGRFLFLVQFMDLTNPMNRKPVLGKHHTEIATDAAACQTLANRTLQLLSHFEFEEEDEEEEDA